VSKADERDEVTAQLRPADEGQLDEALAGFFRLDRVEHCRGDRAGASIERNALRPRRLDDRDPDVQRLHHHGRGEEIEHVRQRRGRDGAEGHSVSPKDGPASS